MSLKGVRDCTEVKLGEAETGAKCRQAGAASGTHCSVEGGRAAWADPRCEAGWEFFPVGKRGLSEALQEINLIGHRG